MTPTITAADRRVRLADFATLTEALDFAAQGETGINFYEGRGKLVLAMPYSVLRTEAQALAGRLLSLGLAPGDRVGLIADTSPDFVRAFFACQYAGLVPAPMPLPAALVGKEAYTIQIARMLSAAGAAAAFGPVEFQEWLEAAGQEAGVRFVQRLDALPESSGAPLPEITPDQMCYLQFSSGSTRSPTGVVVTHRALMANARGITRDGLKVVAADRALSWLPLYHDMGLVGFLLSPLSCQMTIDLLPTSGFVRRPLLWLDLMSRNRATISYSPTFGYELAARRFHGAEEFDLSAWRVAGIGGDMVRPGPLEEFSNAFEKVGFKRTAFVPSYGMAEASLGLTMAPLEVGIRTISVDIDRMERDGIVVAPQSGARQRSFVSCGLIFPEHSLEVRDESGAVLPEHRVGKIFVRGPSLMREYFGQEEATNAVMRDGWLDTGDLGFLDQGEIVITGRAKDLMLLNGRNVWPQDIEWTAETSVAGLRTGDVAAFSVVEDDNSERVVVLVQCRSRDEEVRRRIREGVTGVMRARHGLDVQTYLVGPHALPQTSSGKLSRTRARTMFESAAFDLTDS
ncbi:MAG: fatty acyl-AMP ligase [Caulobacterales bacterium]